MIVFSNTGQCISGITYFQLLYRSSLHDVVDELCIQGSKQSTSYFKTLPRDTTYFIQVRLAKVPEPRFVTKLWKFWCMIQVERTTEGCLQPGNASSLIDSLSICSSLPYKDTYVKHRVLIVLETN